MLACMLLVWLTGATSASWLLLRIFIVAAARLSRFLMGAGRGGRGGAAVSSQTSLSGPARPPA
jgi:hypothetical protein